MKDVTHINLGQPIAHDLIYDSNTHTTVTPNCVSILTKTGVLELECINHDDSVTLCLALHTVMNDKHIHAYIYNRPANLINEFLQAMNTHYRKDDVDFALANVTKLNPFEQLAASVESGTYNTLRDLHKTAQYKVKCLQRCQSDTDKTVKWVNDRVSELDRVIAQLTQLNQQLTTAAAQQPPQPP